MKHYKPHEFNEHVIIASNANSTVSINFFSVSENFGPWENLFLDY